MKLLYVCNDFPYPPRNGGLVDMWNRIQTLHAMGVTCDVIATCAREPDADQKSMLQSRVRRLIIVKRDLTRTAFLSWHPSQLWIRRRLRAISINEHYDAVLMQTQFTTDVLLNPTLQYKTSILRVDNDEVAYCLQTAKADPAVWRKFYYLQDSLKVWLHWRRVIAHIDDLWFISTDELHRHLKREKNPRGVAFVPASIDLAPMERRSLKGSRILFVGNLWTSVNRRAVEWYLLNVHDRLQDVPGYTFVIAGSTQGSPCAWLSKLIKSRPNVEVHFDKEDLSDLYKSSAVFVNPMKEGAGVKLKTLEAVVRGLPIVSTRVGAGGTGLADSLHFRLAEEPQRFADEIRLLLGEQELANSMVARSQQFVLKNYDQQRVLKDRLGAPDTKLDHLALRAEPTPRHAPV